VSEPGAWCDERVWRAYHEWRWIPPSARHAVTEDYELAVTPGTHELSYVYGFRVSPASRVETVLDQLRVEVTSLGARGVKVQVTPTTEPRDLEQRLLRRNSQIAETTEVLVWELQSADGSRGLPEFPMPDGIAVREVRTESEFDEFLSLARPIFGDAAPLPTSIEAFRSDVRIQIGQTGHSGRYLALRETVPVGRGGFEVVGEVARFWGSGVLESHRRHGIYGTLVRAGCRIAVDQGARAAMVVARFGTSGPILTRYGFRVVDRLRCTWAAGKVLLRFIGMDPPRHPRIDRARRLKGKPRRIVPLCYPDLSGSIGPMRSRCRGNTSWSFRDRERS